MMNNNPQKINSQNKILIPVLLYVYVLVLSLCCVGSSPILDYMDPDSQNFRLMGRAVANGQIAFRDIFDHKGLYIFFIDAIGAMITPHSAFGIFLMESTSYFVNAFIIYKVAKRFLKSDADDFLNVDAKAFLSAAAFTAFSFNFFSFVTGNLTESWSLMPQFIAMYLIIDYYFDKDGKASEKIEHPAIYMFLHGLLATIVGFMRPNNAGMWIPFAIVLAVRLFANKKIKNFLVNLIGLVLGVLVGALPLIIYGVKYDLFDEIWYGTFAANMTYSANNNGFDKLGSFLKNFMTNPAILVAILGFAGMAVVIKNIKDNKYFVISYVAMFICSLGFMNVSMRNNGQYQQMYIIFSVPFFMGFFNVIAKKIKIKQMVQIVIWTCLITVAALVANLQLIKQVTKYGVFHYLYEAAQDINELIEDKDASVLVTGCNSVLYNETHTLSHLKYFITYGGGLDYSVFPDATLQQKDSICSLENDYVIIHYTSDGGVYDVKKVDNEIFDTLAEYYDEIYLHEEGEKIGLYKKK